MWRIHPAVPPSPLRALLDLLYPPTCAGCDGPPEPTDPYLCARCALTASWRDPIRCPLCEHPTTHPRQWCHWCLELWPRVERVVALGYYAGPLRRALRIFKYGGYEGMGAWLAEMLARRVVRELGGIDCIVPVPGGRTRRRRRGFDPPAVLARPLARWLAAPIEDAVIIRARDGDHVPSRRRLDRELEVHGRFTCPVRGVLAGRRVLVVDDVYTTGATIEEVGRLLREVAGARSVVGAVVARTVNDALPR